MAKEKTALQEFIENCITAKEHSTDGYVTYDEVIEVANGYLEQEAQQLASNPPSVKQEGITDLELDNLYEKFCDYYHDDNDSMQLRFKLKECINNILKQS